MRRQNRIAVDRKNLLTAIKLVRHAVAKEKSRPILAGISIYSKGDGTIDIVAADGFRLAIYSMPAIVEGKFVGVFPLDLLPKLKERKKEKVVIDIPVADSGLSIARIDGEGIELISNWCPVFRQLIPEELAHKATFAVNELKAALDAVKTVARKGIGTVRLETTEPSTMKIWTEFKDEMITKEIPVNIEGPPGRIALYWKHLRDAINTGANTINFNEMAQPVDVTKVQSCVFTGIPGLIEAVQPMVVEW